MSEDVNVNVGNVMRIVTLAPVRARFDDPRRRSGARVISWSFPSIIAGTGTNAKHRREHRMATTSVGQITLLSFSSSGILRASIRLDSHPLLMQSAPRHRSMNPWKS